MDDPEDLTPVTAADLAYLSAAREADRAQDLADAAAERASVLWEATSWKADSDRRLMEYVEQRKVCRKSGCSNPAVAAYELPGGGVRYLWMCDEHRCQAARADGTRCTSWAAGVNALCAVHQPRTGTRV